MNQPRQLIDLGYSLLSINYLKRPINSAGELMSGWNDKSCADLIKQHYPDGTNFAIRCGEQENGDYIIVLDFDVYNAEGKNEAVFANLQKYIEDGGGGDEKEVEGLYQTGTEGNYAVVLNIAHHKKLMKMVKEMKTYCKHKIECLGGLEILYGNGACKVLPSAKTMCKRNKKVRESVMCNPETDVVVQLMEGGWIENHIEELFEEYKVGKKPPTNTPSTHPTTPTTPTANGIDQCEKWRDLLINYMGNPRTVGGSHLIERTDFIKICACLKDNDFPIELWKEWIALDQRNGDGTKTWNSIKKTDHKMNKGALVNIAKKVNPDRLREWFKKYNNYLTIDVLEKGENDIAMYMERVLPNLKYFVKSWWWYNEATGLWCETDIITHFIVSKLQGFIDDSIAIYSAKNANETNEDEKKKLLEIIKNLTKSRKEVTTGSKSSQIEKLMRGHCKAPDNFFKNMDNNPYQIAFENGIYDLRTATFRPVILPTDFISKTIPFPYKPADPAKKKLTREALKKICNYKETHLKRYLSQFGMMMVGDASLEQFFFNFKGEKGSNGKSIPLDALCDIMPNYVMKLKSDVFEKRNKDRIHKSIATWRGARVLWINEIDPKAPQDESILKLMGDGKPLPFDKHYGEGQVLNLNAKLILVGNGSMKTICDGGIARRWIINQFESDFVEGLETEDYKNNIFKSDKGFDKILSTEWRDEFLELIIEAGVEYVKEKKMVENPIEWKNEKEETADNLKHFDNWFKDNFLWEAGHDDDSEWTVSKMRLEELISHSNVKTTNFREEFKRMRLFNTPLIWEVNKKSKLDGGRGYWRNIREKNEEDRKNEE